MLRVGILSVAHMHVGSYVHAMAAHPLTEIVGFWEHDPERQAAFAEKTGISTYESPEALLAICDAVVICSENLRHTELAVKAANAGKHILCEKPLIGREEDAAVMTEAVEKAGVVAMTAFPCRFSPAFARLKARVEAGEIGKVRAICATNRGSCPWSWFINKAESGGGAMIDHVVHVGDLLRALLGEDAVRVQAQTGNNMYGEDWDDTAMVTLEFPSGVFATLDSSWSRPKGYKTWGDVTMNVVGENGVIELDMFGPSLGRYSTNGLRNAGYGSDLDALMVDAFVKACLEGAPVPTTWNDGIQAARMALAGYRSVEAGQPVAV